MASHGHSERLVVQDRLDSWMKRSSQKSLALDSQVQPGPDSALKKSATEHVQTGSFKRPSQIFLFLSIGILPSRLGNPLGLLHSAGWLLGRREG